MPLDIQKELSELQTMYKDNARTNSFNALIYGAMGTGKTNIARTCRKPVLIHSFDPGGTKTVRDEVEKGTVYVDNRFENEDAMNPTAFAAWDK